MLWTPDTSAWQRSHRPVHRGSRWFCAALGLALLGGGALLLAITAAFGRWGTGWDDAVAAIGIGVLVLAGLCNLAAACMAIDGLVRQRTLQWWHLPSLALVALSLYGGWIALTL